MTLPHVSVHQGAAASLHCGVCGQATFLDTGLDPRAEAPPHLFKVWRTPLEEFEATHRHGYQAEQSKVRFTIEILDLNEARST